MAVGTGRNADEDRHGVRMSPWWWFRQVILTGIGCFFVCFGISLLAASYGLGNPFSFIMTFFAASLIILISAVMVLGFVLRIRRVMQAGRSLQTREADDQGTT